jgi:N-acetylglucosaminyl-diphospho-decaprenol L-rhamnosyltransferase
LSSIWLLKVRRKVVSLAQRKLTSVIVSYNSAATIADLLSDLRKVCSNQPVMVIDNASTNQTVDLVSCQFPEVRLVRNRQNLGYGRAANLGFKLSNTPYVFILNPDIRILSHHVIIVMVNFLEDFPFAGSAAPIQYILRNEGNRLNFTCSYLGWKSFKGYLHFQMYHTWPSQDPIKVPLLNTGCIMIRRSAYLKIGGINPKYFLYGEDPEIGLKPRHSGYESWLMPGVSVIHYRESSLRTLSKKQHWHIHWQAVGNISHAFLTGWW